MVKNDDSYANGDVDDDGVDADGDDDHDGNYDADGDDEGNG